MTTPSAADSAPTAAGTVDDPTGPAAGAMTDAPATTSSDADEPATTPRRARWRRAVRHAPDGLALLVLFAVFSWLSTHDGGAPTWALTRVAIPTAIAAPLAVVEARRLPRWVQVLLAWWGVGVLLSLAWAAERSQWVHPTLVLTVVPVVGLLAHRLWRRRWGPAVVLLLLLVAFGQYWYRSFLQWWGSTMEPGSGVPTWLPLSWHNQSAMLMGGLGLLFAGVATTTRRTVPVVLTLLAGAAFGGVWLTGSRGGMLSLAVGAVVLLVVAARAAGPRRVAAVAAGTGAVAAAVAVGLLTMVPAGAEGGVQPLANKGETVENSTRLRLYHMEAAAGMFADRPVTGQGLGSYRVMAQNHTRPEAGLTSSAHNEYAEVLGEGGLALGVPFLALLPLGGALVWRHLRRADERGHHRPTGPRLHAADLRGPLTVGAVGVVVALLVHAGLDFDWNYPVLPSLLVVGLVALSPTAGAEAPSRGADGLPLVRGLVVLPLLAALGFGIWGGATERLSGQAQEDLSPMEFATGPAPWQSDRAMSHALTLVDNGDVEAARLAIDRALSWSPADQRLVATRALVEYEAGTVGPDVVLRALDPIGSRFWSYNRAARRFLDHDQPAAAREALATVLPYYADYEAWGVDRIAAESWALRLETAERLEGCDGVGQVRGELLDAPVLRAAARDELVNRADELCP